MGISGSKTGPEATEFGNLGNYGFFDNETVLFHYHSNIIPFLQLQIFSKLYWN